VHAVCAWIAGLVVGALWWPSPAAGVAPGNVADGPTLPWWLALVAATSVLAISRSITRPRTEPGHRLIIGLALACWCAGVVSAQNRKLHVAVCKAAVVQAFTRGDTLSVVADA